MEAENLIHQTEKKQPKRRRSQGAVKSSTSRKEEAKLSESGAGLRARDKVILSSSATQQLTSSESSGLMEGEKIVKASTSAARSFIDKETALKLNVLPYKFLTINKIKTLIVFCSSRSANIDLRNNLKFLTESEIEMYPLDLEDLSGRIQQAYNGDEKELFEVKSRLCAEARLIENSIDQIPAVKNAGRGLRLEKIDPRKGEGAIVEFVNVLVDYSIANHASDIHILPCKNGTYITLRIDGDLHRHEFEVCSLQQHEQVITRLKVLASLNIAIRNRPQDGCFSFNSMNVDWNLRIGLMPSEFGESAVIRIVGSQRTPLLSELLTNTDQLKKVKELIRQKEGLILLCGPTGSGKSTLLYSIMEESANCSKKIVSIEDPPEKLIAGVTQSTVDHKNNVDYLQLIKAALRQDPDIIVIGEIRGTEEMKAAIQGALTGHNLFSTFHAGNTYEVFLRIRELGIDLITFTQVLKAVIHLRLHKKLCDHCRIIDLTASNKLELKRKRTNQGNYVHVDFNSGNDPQSLYKKNGCQECSYTGFQGRELSVEIFECDDEIRGKFYGGFPSSGELN